MNELRIDWKTELSQLGIIAIMFIAGAYSWNSLPKHVPIQWGPSGPDAYGGKDDIFLLPVVAVAIYLYLFYKYVYWPRKYNILDGWRDGSPESSFVVLAKRVGALAVVALAYANLLHSTLFPAH